MKAYVYVVFLVTLSGCHTDTAPVSKTQQESATVLQFGQDDAKLVRSRCGRPDSDDSTQNDRPRPPMVTRWFVYKKTHVKVFFIQADGHVGDPPPYRWKFLAAADIRTKHPLSSAQIQASLPCLGATR